MHLWILPLLFLFCAISSVQSCIAYADPPGQEPPTGDPFAIHLNLGDTNFTNSGSEEAQPWFKNGLLLLHNFWYDLAASYFQQAQIVDPNFAMAYWGEAMCQNQQLWLSENAEVSESIMAKIPDEASVTDREMAYIEAANVLFSQNPLSDRYFQYNKKMKIIHQTYPEDADAAAFYGLSTLSLLAWDLITFDEWENDYFNETLTLLQEVTKMNPQHPGGPHYLIHSCDDPVNPKYALDACQEYPKIATDTSHAHHMPSHIYYRLGLWNDSFSADLTSWNVSVWYADLVGQTPSCGYDWHSLRWLIYTELQQGKWSSSLENIEDVKQLDDDYLYFQYTDALQSAGYIIETEKWNDTNSLVPPFIQCPTCGDTRDTSSFFHWTHLGNSAILTAKGLASVHNNEDTETVESWVKLGKQWEAELQETEPYYAGLYGVAWRQIQARAILKYGAHEDVHTLMDEAVAIELNSGVPHDGPPVPIQPSHELYGYICLELEENSDALDHFESSLKDIPGRVRSLLGKARAQHDLGDSSGAAQTYQTLMYQYYQADQNIPPYIEASEYLASSEGTTTDTESSTGSSDSSDSGPPIGGIIVISIVVAAVVVLFGVMAVYLIRRHKSKPKADKLMMDSDINYLYA